MPGGVSALIRAPHLAVCRRPTASDWAPGSLRAAPKVATRSTLCRHGWWEHDAVIPLPRRASSPDRGVNDVRLRTGVTVADALRALGELTTEADNLAHGTLGIHPTDQRDAYLTWAEKAESHLRHFFVAMEPWGDLFSVRYWYLYQLTTGTPHAYSLIRTEATWQSERLRGLADRLRDAQQLFELPVGHVAIVPDTNVFAHYRMFDQIPWPELTKSASVRVVVALLVLDELDDLSYKARAAGQRAKDALRALAKLRSDARPEAPVDIQRGVTLQVLPDPPGHVRQANNDDELLTRIDYLATVVGNRVSLATGDYGMQVRAGARGIACIRLPDELRLQGS